MNELPIVCTLTARERRARREELLRGLVTRAEERTPLQSGYSFRFAARDGLVEEIGRVIEVERGCCAFLRFDLSIAAGGGPVWLPLPGPPGTKEFLSTEIEATAP